MDAISEKDSLITLTTSKLIAPIDSELQTGINSEILHEKKLNKKKKFQAILSHDTDGGADTIFLNNLYSGHASLHLSEQDVDSRIQHLANESYKLYSSDMLLHTAYNTNKRRTTKLLTDNLYDDTQTNLVMWNRHFPGTSILESEQVALTYNKFACCFDLNDSFTSFYETLRLNLFVFLIELFRGTTEECHELICELRLTKHFLSRVINNPIQYSGLCIISSRYSSTGIIKSRLNSVILCKGNKIIVTADRKFARKGSKNVIYVNCYDVIKELQPCDYILMDNTIRLKVIEQVNVSVMCEIICGGTLKRGMSVIFPSNCNINIRKVTTEEQEDIIYSLKEKINCIILPTCDCDIYLNSIKKFLNSVNFHYCRLFATVYASDINTIEEANLIIKNYDGLNLYIYKNYIPGIRILQLSDIVKYLIEQFYFLKKPILVGQFFLNNKVENQSMIIHPDSEKHLLYYPDKFVFKITQLKYYFIFTFLNVLDVSKFSMIEYALNDLMLHLPDKSPSESDIFARAVVQNSYSQRAKCIVLSSRSGRMAIKISHYRPNIPIIVLCDNLNIVRYLSIYNNVWLVYYKEYNAYNTVTLSFKKLLCAILYAVSHNILMEGDKIVYVYSTIYGSSPNKMSVMAVTNTLLRNIAIK